MKGRFLMLMIGWLLSTRMAMAGVNCFTDGVLGLVLTTEREYTPIANMWVTHVRADVYRHDGQMIHSMPGIFILGADWSKTAIFAGQVYAWDENFVAMHGNDFVMGWCGEDGTPTNPGMMR